MSETNHQRLVCTCPVDYVPAVHALGCPSHAPPRAPTADEDLVAAIVRERSRREAERASRRLLTRQRWQTVDAWIRWAYSDGANPQAARGIDPAAALGLGVNATAQRQVTVRSTGRPGGPPGGRVEAERDRATVIAAVGALGRTDLSGDPRPDPFGHVQQFVTVWYARGWSYDRCHRELCEAREAQPRCPPEEREQAEIEGRRVPACGRDKLILLHRTARERLSRRLRDAGLLPQEGM